MKPTVGRIVHFYRAMLGAADGVFEGPWPAIVVQVHGEHCVSLHAWKRDNIQEFASSVMHKDLVGDASTYWEWPPRE